jgi:hypothetical protein
MGKFANNRNNLYIYRLFLLRALGAPTAPFRLAVLS